MGYLGRVHVLGCPELQPVMLSVLPWTQCCCDRGITWLGCHQDSTHGSLCHLSWPKKSHRHHHHQSDQEPRDTAEPLMSLHSALFPLELHLPLTLVPPSALQEPHHSLGAADGQSCQAPVTAWGGSAVPTTVITGVGNPSSFGRENLSQLPRNDGRENHPSARAQLEPDRAVPHRGLCATCVTYLKMKDYKYK